VKPSQIRTLEATPHPHPENYDTPSRGSDEGTTAEELPTTTARAFAFFYCGRADADHRKPELTIDYGLALLQACAGFDIRRNKLIDAIARGTALRKLELNE
jgi:hypothetical protein